MADPVTTTGPPASTSGGGLARAQRWIGSHKVLAIGGGGVLAFLFLSRRGTGVIAPAAVAATDESGTGGGGGGGGEGDETLPPDTPLPPDDPPPPDTAAPPAEQPPISLGPTAPTPTPPTPSAPKSPPLTISTVPAQTSPAAQPTVTYSDVPGYMTVLQVVRGNGHVQTWHHYTSGTRKGDKLKMDDVGVAWGWPWRSAPAGWSPATGVISDSVYQRTLSQVQYEVTHQAVTNTP